MAPVSFRRRTISGALLQTTGGAETYALAGAIAMIRTYKNEPVIEHLYHAGDRLRTGIGQVVARRGLEAQVPLMGRSCCLLYGSRDADGNPSPASHALSAKDHPPWCHHAVIGGQLFAYRR